MDERDYKAMNKQINQTKMTKEQISAFLKANKKESDQSIADNLKIKQERVNEFLNAKYNYRIDTLLKFLNYFGFKIKLVKK